jgi:hypothetical protein
VIISCLYCAKEKEIYKSAIKNGYGKFCDHRCSGLYHTASIEERFWSRVDVLSIEECWDFKGAPADGYGRIGFNGKDYYAHRLIWEMTYGPIPDGLFVCHRCDNPPCVNPSHLFLGTDEENKRDMIRKGRHFHGERASECQKGERNPSAILIEGNVYLIRQKYSSGVYTYEQLGKEYGVTKGAIYRIIKGKTWGWLGETKQTNA